jgi:hypothetical protein
MPKPLIIKPGDAEFDQAQASLTSKDVELLVNTVKGQASAMRIGFSEVQLRQGTVEYAAIEMTETSSKLVFHFKNVSKNFSIKLSAFFWNKVRGIIITPAMALDGAAMQCGENELYRSNWDVIIFNLNKYIAPAIQDTIVRRLLEEFRV